MSVAANQMIVLPGTNSQYTHEDYHRAVVAYLTLGNLHKVAAVIDIPRRTLYGWTKTTWWAELLNHVRQEKRDEFDAGFTRLIDKTINTIEIQLDAGEVKARDAATIMGIAFDKRQILNLKPTSITAKTTDINGLQAQFEDYLKAKTIEADVIQTD